MSEPFLAEIKIVGFNFPPRGWAQCDGQILLISQNQSLYSLLGTTYGGNGRTDFALPDLRGRIPFHTGHNVPGYESGHETCALSEAEMPPHTHPMRASSLTGDSTNPGQHLAARSPVGDLQYASAANSTMPDTAGTGGAEHNNMPPFLALNFCIALLGVFPSRN